ncbi:glycosyltransferase [Cytobacillus sp.]|uniref:glycosyltransferase family 4 protein n=1 Tax=Cytobacillus sp. TaxID=2675269 RepID=UPI0028BEDBFF|nr:glycosyltransferase [Cytobacillus sp.]
MIEPSSISWLGPVGDIGGYGNVSRNYLRALNLIGLPIQIIYNGPIDQELGKDDILLLSNSQMLHWPVKSLDHTPVLIIHGTPESFAGINKTGYTKKIGITIFETDRIPENWVNLCNDNDMDEIWVPTQFNYRTFTESGVNPSKVKVIHYPIDFTQYDQEFAPYPFPEKVKSFRFLYSIAFDYRKGLDLLIPSYCEEFSDKEDVSLIIKIYVPGWNNDDNFLKEISSYIPVKENNPHIHFIIEKMPRETLLSLYSSCTCYVSTERACGWGMPQMEMMAMGKPVIAVNWGGVTEFMNQNNSFLIEREQELEYVHDKLQMSRPELYLGHKWAKVTKQNVKEKLREAFESHNKREEVASQARQDIRNHFSFQKIASQIKERIFA